MEGKGYAQLSSPCPGVGLHRLYLDSALQQAVRSVVSAVGYLFPGDKLSFWLTPGSQHKITGENSISWGLLLQ